MKNVHFIRPGLLAELRHKRDTLLNKVSDETGLRTSLLEAAHLDASYHSRITEPDQAVRAQRIGRRKDFREVRGKLEEAREYAKSKFMGVVTDEFILDLAQIIEPGHQRGYRSESAYLSDHGDFGVNPAKISEQMTALNNIANNSYIDPVERAIIFHLHFLRIHPLRDGNGRVARFMQNLVLANHIYAPAILEPAERSFYNDLIHDARVSFKEREAEGDVRAPELMGIPPAIKSPESEFMHYMATKVNVGMDRLIGDYDKLGHYQIQLNGIKDPGQVMRVGKILRNYFNRLGLPAQVSVIDRKKGTLEVRADTNDCALAKILDNQARLPYRIYRYD